jgi:hypothetical protein
MIGLLIVKEKPNGDGEFVAIKLFDDGETQDVAEHDFEFAVDWITSKEARKMMHPRRPWKPWGIWYHNHPGVVFAETRGIVLSAWRLRGEIGSKLIVPAPCTFQDRTWWQERNKTRDWDILTSVKFVGEVGVISPTLTQIEIVKKRYRHLWYAGDLAMVPEAILLDLAERQKPWPQRQREARPQPQIDTEV